MPRHPSQQEVTSSAVSSRDNHLWLQLWRDKNQASFHQEQVNTLLTRFWSTLNLPPHSRVFVPLCGKSLDMLWLAKQGHEVIGVELSPIAVKAFFRENKMKPSKRKMGEFTLWHCGRITVLCGNYFALSKEVLGDIETVYDRAALTALPEDIRKLYVTKLQQIVPAKAGIFLLTIEDSDKDTPTKQATSVDKELTSLYARSFDIDLAHVEQIQECRPEAPHLPPQHVAYKLYKLSNKSLPACA